MREIVLDKVVINIGVGEAGERLLRADRVLELLGGQKPVHTISKTTNKDLGIRKGMEIGTKVTLRGKKAEEFLERAFWVMQNKIMSYSFDQEGNFSFGIRDYTDFKDMKYDPEIGIFGMDISAVLKRKGGRRVADRRIMKRRIPHRHRITREEGMEFVKRKFNVEVIE
ncbi:MAG: 50S ribosomal protein L5 [Thermoplasmata archaeon]|nr:50S ribosomal protein L5 [Thermoplasmata archaeon]